MGNAEPPSRQTGGVKSRHQKWLGLRSEVLGSLRPPLNASTKLQDITPSGPPGLTAEREARKEEALDNVPCRKGRERTIVTESDEHWSCLKGNVWGTSASERLTGRTEVRCECVCVCLRVCFTVCLCVSLSVGGSVSYTHLTLPTTERV